MKRERKKTIIDFNHIDPSIPPEKLEEIEKLYTTYKRLWWCFKQVHQKQKRLDLLEKIISSVLVAGGVVAGGVTLNPIVLGVISGLGLILKTIQEAKNRGKKIEKAKFAFTNYEKALSTLKFALRGGEFEPRKFLVEMETLDGIVIDFVLNQEKFEKKRNLRRNGGKHEERGWVFRRGKQPPLRGKKPTPSRGRGVGLLFKLNSAEKSTTTQGEMNPLPRDGVGFCFFLLKFSRKSTHLIGEKTSSENESFEKMFLF